MTGKGGNTWRPAGRGRPAMDDPVRRGTGDRQPKYPDRLDMHYTVTGSLLR